MHWTTDWKRALLSSLALALACVVWAPGLAAEGFELEVTFLTPSVVQCETETNPIGRQECVSVTVEARFENVGGEPSARHRVALNMYRGPRASGYATRFGGPAAMAALPALAPGDSVTLDWTARRVQLGQYTFRPHYTPPLEIRGGDHHHDTHTVTIEGQP